MRLLLNVTVPITDKIMVFGQAPCSAGRSKRRNISYLGLLPAPIDGLADITALYVARYGKPKPGEKVFIVTRQQKNGWESPDHVTSEIVPGEAEAPQSAVPGPQSAAPGIASHAAYSRRASGQCPPFQLLAPMYQQHAPVPQGPHDYLATHQTQRPVLPVQLIPLPPHTPPSNPLAPPVAPPSSTLHPSSAAPPDAPAPWPADCAPGSVPPLTAPSPVETASAALGRPVVRPRSPTPSQR